MSKKKMLINMVHEEESRIAIIDGHNLEDLYVESAGREQVKGNIYKGVVVSIAKSLQACFVDFGGGRAGFLSIDEIDPRFFRKSDDGRKTEESAGPDQKGRRKSIEEVVRLKQDLLVQVVKEELGTKGASLTTYISIPGRYLVLMPGAEEVGISRKVENDTQRKRLRDVIDSLDVPEGLGLIVRTAGSDRTKTELVKDFSYLRRLWSAIEEASARCRAPALIYQERDLVTRAIRDHFTSDISMIVVDNKEIFERALDFLRTFLPRQQRILELYEGHKPLFSEYRIEEQIDTIFQHQVRLPSGGAIVIDPTEALVSIDVNSAKATQEKNAEETAVRTNLEAAEEIARQLRLRDLGGIIVIDFIDMRESKNKRNVERALKSALKMDRARLNVGRISKLGLVELSRQRLKPAIMDRNYLVCPACNGVGMVKSTESKALILLRKLQATAADGNLAMVRASLPIDVYTYLLNRKRTVLHRLESELGVKFDFRLKTGWDEQIFDSDCLELINRIPEAASGLPRSLAAVQHSVGYERESPAVGRDRVHSEVDLPPLEGFPDFDPDEEAAEGQPPATPPQRAEPQQRQGERDRDRDRGRSRGRGGRQRRRDERRPGPAQRPPQASPPAAAQRSEGSDASRTVERARTENAGRPPLTAARAETAQVPGEAGVPAAGANAGQPRGPEMERERSRRRRRRGRGRGGRGREAAAGAPVQQQPSMHPQAPRPPSPVVAAEGPSEPREGERVSSASRQDAPSGAQRPDAFSREPSSPPEGFRPESPVAGTVGADRSGEAAGSQGQLFTEGRPAAETRVPATPSGPSREERPGSDAAGTSRADAPSARAGGRRRVRRGARPKDEPTRSRGESARPDAEPEAAASPSEESSPALTPGGTKIEASGKAPVRPRIAPPRRRRRPARAPRREGGESGDSSTSSPASDTPPASGHKGEDTAE